MRDLASIYKVESNQERHLKSVSDLCLHTHTQKYRDAHSHKSAWMHTHKATHTSHMHTHKHTHMHNPYQKGVSKARNLGTCLEYQHSVN